MGTRRKKTPSSAKCAQMLKDALISQNRYTTDLDSAITVCAGHLMVYQAALAAIERDGVTLTTMNQYGEMPISHPAVTTVARTSEQIVKYLKILGLTYKDVTIEDSGDALSNFDKGLDD